MAESENIFATLRNDHLVLRKLLEKVARTPSGSPRARGKWFGELRRELESHLAAEETVVYGVLERNFETHDSAMEGYGELALVRQLLQLLQKLPCDDPQWEVCFTELAARLEGHFECEQSDVFERLRSALDPRALRELGSQFLKARSEPGGEAALCPTRQAQQGRG